MRIKQWIPKPQNKRTERQPENTVHRRAAGFSAGVSAESPELRAKIVQAMQKFRNFCPENDPYGEHDFGKISVEDGEYFWKIDYYDLDYRFLSPDAADPAVTRRVLTLMKTDEW